MSARDVPLDPSAESLEPPQAVAASMTAARPPIRGSRVRDVRRRKVTVVEHLCAALDSTSGCDAGHTAARTAVEAGPGPCRPERSAGVQLDEPREQLRRLGDD